MKTGARLSGREPDILFIATANLARLTKTYVKGPADLVVEIISPESETRDRVTKYREYALGGVREYWLLDPDKDQFAFYRLNEEGRFEPIPPDSEGIVRSVVLAGLWLDLEWLQSRPLPSLMSILRAWELI
jgi:Uma2 family endonuclease